VQLSERERRAWLRLARTENVGPVTFRNLLARFGSASAALEELPRLASRGGGKNFVLPPEEDSAQELEALAKLGGRLIASCEAEFPPGLKALEAPPPVLSVLGHPHLLQKEMIAIVGARNASALARKFADILARELGFAGLVIVSGLARGIDAAAHEAALAVGTVGVVAGGVDIIYPPENEKLYGAIRNQGVILSEMPRGLCRSRFAARSQGARRQPADQGGRRPHRKRRRHIGGAVAHAGRRIPGTRQSVTDPFHPGAGSRSRPHPRQG